jgi:hypothetical protein
MIEMGALLNYLPGLTLNLHPPDLSLPSNKDYRCEPPLAFFSLEAVSLQVAQLDWNS